MTSPLQQIPPGSVPSTAPDSAPALPLRDLHLPDPISWWPLAPGWWVLIAIVLVLLIWASWKAVRWYLAKRPLLKRKKAALSYLEDMKTDWVTMPESDQIQQLSNGVSQLNILMKRLIQPDAPHALHLHGQPWSEFLNQSGSKALFNNDQADLLANAAYRPVQSDDLNKMTLLFDACQQWIRSYQPQPSSKNKRHALPPTTKPEEARS